MREELFGSALPWAIKEFMRFIFFIYVTAIHKITWLATSRAKAHLYGLRQPWLSFGPTSKTSPTNLGYRLVQQDHVHFTAMARAIRSVAADHLTIEKDSNFISEGDQLFQGLILVGWLLLWTLSHNQAFLSIFSRPLL